MRFVDWLDNQKVRKAVSILSYITLFIVVAADFFIERHHIAFFWDEIAGFSALYGFISCVLIIIISKAVGHAWLMKKEDYYD